MKQVWSDFFGFLQKLGKSLMLPVAVLPVAGILLGVGGAFIGNYHQQAIDLGYCTVDGVAVAGDPAACLAQLPKVVVGDPVAAGVVAKPLFVFLQILQNSGDPIFSALGLIFAIGVALGLAKNDGVSALAATVGYLVMNGTMGVVAAARGITTAKVLGLDTLDTGVFGGILVGIIAGYMFNRFYRITLPPYLGFFAGKRFVPIVTAFAAIALGIVLAFVWPPIGSFIENTANQVISANAPVAVFVYGLVERALLPFGLHHIWNAPFFYQINVGGWADCNGILTCFFRGHPESGIFGGGFLVKMFGLCGAALAIWRTAKPENRVRIGSIMLAGRAHHLPHRHHRAARVLVPLRRAAAVRRARLPVRLRVHGDVPARRPARLHVLPGRHRLRAVLRERHQAVAGPDRRADLLRHLLRRLLRAHQGCSR